MVPFDAASEVTEDDAGWVWLGPRRQSLRARHAVASATVAGLILAVMVVTTFLPGWRGLLVAAPVVAAGVLLVRRTAHDAVSRIALADAGLVLENGPHEVRVAWAGVTAVRGTRAGRRVRVVVGTRQADVATTVTFERAAAGAWLERVTAEARRRNLDPRPAAGGLGFEAA